jgi:hypothetical protein
LLHPRPLQKQKAYHWRVFTPANNQTIWPLQWWIITPAFSLRARKEDATYFDNPYSPKSPIIEGVTSQDLFPDYIDAKSGLDDLSYQILMLNNLYMRLLSNYQVNHIADKFRGENALALQKGVTPDPSFIQDALDIEDIIFEIFRSEKPLSLIDKHRGNFDSYF